MIIKYKDKTSELRDEALFKYSEGTLLKYRGYTFKVVQYSQSPFDLSPAISCYLLKPKSTKGSELLAKE
jgi:hypothetical protein